MAHFMGYHAAQLLGRKQAHDALGHGHHRMLRITARGKGVGGLFRHHADARLGNAGIAGQLFHNPVQIGGFLRGQFPGMVHGKHDFVRVPVAAHIHHEGQAEGDDHAGAAAHQAAKHDNDAGQQGQQKNCFYLAGHKILLIFKMRWDASSLS